jgi:hypothetical protein
MVLVISRNREARGKCIGYIVTAAALLCLVDADLGCLSRIRLFSSRIPDPGVKKAPDPRSGSATLVALHCGSTQCKRKLGMKSSEGIQENQKM